MKPVKFNPQSFSRRTNWPKDENRIALLTQSIIASKQEFTDFTVSNPTQTSIRLPIKKMLSQLTRYATPQYHPDPRGTIETRQSIQKYYAEKGIDVSTDDILLTPGTSESYLFALKLLANHQDEVIVQKPGYPLIEMLTRIADANPVTQPAYCVDSRKIIKPDLSKTGHAKALFIVQPQNPTGAAFNEKISTEIAREATQQNIPVISDEVFLDFTFGTDEPYFSWANLSESPAIVMSGISKLLCLPQAKLSWMLLCGPKDWKTEAMNRLLILSDTFLSSSPVIQQSTPHWFTFQAEITQTVNERLAENFRYISEICRDQNEVNVVSQPAGWSVVLEINHDDESYAYELLKSTGILVQPGYLFDIEENNCIIISLLTDPNILRKSLPKALDFLFSLGK